MSFNWPYYSFANLNKYIFIYNAFNPRFVQRYQLPEDTVICSHTFLTDTTDLYIHTETYNNECKILHVDLDDDNPKINLVFSYPRQRVRNKALINFHVRGSSAKEKINLNESLMCFMLHGTTLFVWREGKEHIDKIDETVDNMYYLSDKFFFYKTTKTINVRGNEV